MHFTSISFVAAAFAVALTITGVARAADPNDPVVKACIRKCEVEQATKFEAAVENYPDADNQNLTVPSNVSKGSKIMLEAEAGLNACAHKCQITLSTKIEKCIIKNPITDSDARLDCNRPAVAAERKCEDQCRAIAIKCWDRCFDKANAAWEPCVTAYKDPKVPKRLKCINDVENAHRKCGGPCQ
ncbi:hypothetical protein BGZ93_006773 [Podila epicladia]|nr:hypothetical protein BGZ92_006954 [Podila epicladia]KAG0094792.1 hypothetical protein BGZ93_006773 [Podila epicladia]